MKNDFDFIKNKIENSGVSAPQDMDESYVLNTLEGVYPQPAAVQPKRKRKAAVIAISASAAALVFAAALGLILSMAFYLPKTTGEALPGGLALRQFHTREEVTGELESIKAEDRQVRLIERDSYSEDMPAEDAAPESPAAIPDQNVAAPGANDSASNNSAADSDRSSSHSDTYKQVQGVDEADIIKTDGKYIYCVDKYHAGKNKVVIFSAQGDASEKVAEITADGAVAPATPDEADRWDVYYTKGCNIVEMFLRDDRLILICNDTDYYGNSLSSAQTKVYDISDINNITLIDSFSQSGTYKAGRMIDDTLYLVSSYTSYDGTNLPDCGRGDDAEEIPADCIYALDGNDSRSFLVLSAYDTLNHDAQIECKSILGKVKDIYCNQDHMYLYATHSEKKPFSFLRLFDKDKTSAKNSQILKVDLSDGINFTAYTEVEGAIDDRYALDEYDGNLRVATTTQAQRDSNNLFVMDEDLTVIGAVTGFARNEQIKAVRYVGDTAYVITYKKTDPLFVIDLSEPTDPTILGEVKISGFSTMLVPIDENTILGLGYHTSDGGLSDMEAQTGFKLVLFDVSDKLNPKVLDTMIYKDCTSVVQSNPKALVYNADRGDYIVPLNGNYGGLVDGGGSDVMIDSEGGDVVAKESYGGVLNFKVEGKRLKEIGHFQSDHSSVDRCVYIGDTVYMTYRDSSSDYELQIDSVPYKK